MSAATISTREQAAALDAADPLAAFRERFAIADERVVYLDGNSLGRLPLTAVEALDRTVRREWGERLIRSWSEGWMELPLRIGDRLGEALLGAAPGQVAVADSTTICLHKLAAAALDARPGRDEIVTDTANFPTDRYVLQALAAQRGLTVRWVAGDPLHGPSAEDVAAVVSERTALVAFSHVDYRSAALLPMAAITRVAHDAGALVLWDLCHSAGAVPVALDVDGVDLAVGCTYKYLNGGPGSPAFLYVRREHQDVLRQPLCGWMGSRDAFAMGPSYEPAAGVRGFLSGTPPVLALAGVEAGVELSAQAGIERIHAKGIALTELAIALADAQLAAHGVAVASPREAARRGSHVSLTHPDAASLCQALIARGVIGDFRQPDVLRLGLSPLTTRFTDVWDGCAALHELLR